MRISVKRSDQPGDIRERFPDYRTSGFCQCAHAERFTRLEEPKDVKRIKNFTALARRGGGSQGPRRVQLQAGQQAGAITAICEVEDYYIIDRLGLSTTMCVYENYYRPAASFAGRAS